MILFQSNILFVMSLSGTVLFLLYIVTSLFTQKYFTAKWRYNLLKLCLLFYLFPFPEFRYRMQNVLEALHISIPYHWWDNQNIVGNMKFIKNTIHIGADRWILSDVVKCAWGIVIFSGITAVIIMSVQIVKYFRVKKGVLITSIPNQQKEFLILKKIKKELNIKNNVQLIYSEICDSPFTIGIFSPIIVLPLNRKSTEEQLDFIFRHELNHIKNKDFIVKFIAMAVVVLHWFNPICILLYFEISNLSEIYCDSETVKNYDNNLIKEYSFYMVDFAINDYNKNKKLFYTGLISRHSKVMARRLINLKRITKNKKNGIFSIATAFVMCCLSMNAVFAYEAPVEIHLKEGEEIKGERVELLTDEPITFNSWDDTIIVDNNGNTYEIGNQNKAYCKHHYVSCTFGEHNTHSDGSCITYMYEADKCINCGDKINQKLTNELSYKKCPH